MAIVYHKKMARRYIIGIDEVGRGPLAGPVTVAAVLKPARFVWKNFKDSKKLSPEKRDEFFLKFKTMQYAISSVSNIFIDKFGIAVAIRLAVGRCLSKLKNQNAKFKITVQNSKILLDGSLFAPKDYQNQKTIIKGDEKIPIIAVASIIAKVKRDRAMVRLHKKFPEYGFAVHKGYGTKLHQEAIKTHGLCKIHRRSFCKKFV